MAFKAASHSKLFAFAICNALNAISSALDKFPICSIVILIYPKANISPSG